MPHLVRYKDKQYDIESFIDKHPGGRNLLLDAKDCDITEVVQSYHPSKTLTRIEAILQKLPTSTPKGNEGTRNYAEGEKNLGDKTYNFSKNYIEQRDKLYDKPLPSVDPNDIILWVFAAFFFIGIKWMFEEPESFLVQLLDGLFKGCSMVVVAGYGHQYVHLSSPKASFITLAGFHCNHWRYEHVYSHHPYTNTCKDVDLFDFKNIDGQLPIPPFLKYMIVSSVIVARPYWRYVMPKYIMTLTRYDWAAVIYCIWDVYFNFGVSWLVKKHLVAMWFLLIDYFNHYKDVALVRTTDDWDKQQIAASSNFVLIPFLYDNYPFIHSLFCFGLDRQVEHHLFPRLKMEHLSLVSEPRTHKHIVGAGTVDTMMNEFVWMRTPKKVAA